MELTAKDQIKRQTWYQKG